MAAPGSNFGRKFGRAQTLRPIALASPAAPIVASLHDPFLYPKFWDTGRPADFIAPNLLLTVLVAAAAIFPAGRSNSTELPPRPAQTSRVQFHVQQQNFQQFLTPAIQSARALDTPVLPTMWRAPFQVLQQKAPLSQIAALPSARALDIPLVTPFYRASVAFRSDAVPGLSTAVAIASAKTTDLPTLAARFIEGSFPANFLPLRTPVVAKPFAQYDWSLPPQAAPFWAVLVMPNLLQSVPPAPFSQADWPLPVKRADRTAIDWQAPPPFSHAALVASIPSARALDTPVLSPAWRAPFQVLQLASPLAQTGVVSIRSATELGIPVPSARFMQAQVTATSIITSSGGGPVFPLPNQVQVGVIYGPNGNDYIGTAIASGIILIRR